MGTDVFSCCLQKMFTRKLSSKLRWSKKQASAHHQAMTAGITRLGKTLDIDWFLHQMMWSMTGRSCKTAKEKLHVCLVLG
jgi:hypothetical protein